MTCQRKALRAYRYLSLKMNILKTLMCTLTLVLFLCFNFYNCEVQLFILCYDVWRKVSLRDLYSWTGHMFYVGVFWEVSDYIFEMELLGLWTSFFWTRTIGIMKNLFSFLTRNLKKLIFSKEKIFFLMKKKWFIWEEKKIQSSSAYYTIKNRFSLLFVHLT